MSKTVAINADKARNLKYTVNSLIELEKVSGKSFMNFGEDISFEDVRAMVYAGLKWEDKKLTLEKAGEVMDAAIENEGMEGLMEKINKAIGLSFNGGSFPKK